MQTTPNLMPPIEYNPITELQPALPVPPTLHFRRRAAGAVAGIALALTATGCASDETYNPTNLAAAPHDARVMLPPGTEVVYEEFEDRECAKKANSTIAAHMGALAAPTTSKPPTTKTPKPTTPSKVPIPRCEGSEVQVEACQTGVKPDTDPKTTAKDCVHVDFGPDAFVAATGQNEVSEGQPVMIKKEAIGTADRD